MLCFMTSHSCRCCQERDEYQTFFCVKRKIQDGGAQKILFRPTETLASYHLAKKSGNFGLKSNGKVIFRTFLSKIVEYLQRYFSLFKSGMERRKIPYHLNESSVSRPFPCGLRTKRVINKMPLNDIFAGCLMWPHLFPYTLRRVLKLSSHRN